MAGEHLLLADTPDDFVDCCIRLLVAPVLGATLAGNARRLVEEGYSWTGIGNRLLATVDELVKKE